MAAIHAASFATPRPWTEAEFRDLIGDALILRVTEADGGFGLLRIIAGEGELLTIAVDPALRRRGIGTRLLAEMLRQAGSKGVATIFLEVAANNVAAQALYRAADFGQVGQRRDYYAPGLDALIFRRTLGART